MSALNFQIQNKKFKQHQLLNIVQGERIFVDGANGLEKQP
jgi:hypothetical protein